jgi:hypothetical protein
LLPLFGSDCCAASILVSLDSDPGSLEVMGSSYVSVVI